MRQYTFWPKYGSVQTPLVGAAAGFLIWGLVNIGYGLASAPPARSALTRVSGKLDKVVRLPKGRFAAARSDVALTTQDGTRATAKIVDNTVSHDRLTGLMNETVVLEMDRDHWVFALSAGGREILGYGKSRQLWLADARARVDFGIVIGAIGLLLGLAWLLRRRKAQGGSQTE